MNLLNRWKAPTPEFFKKIFKFSLLLAAAAAANMMAGTIGAAIIPGFTWTLYPWAMSLCKYLVVGGVIAAAVSKAAKIDISEETLNIKKTTTTDADMVTNTTEITTTKTEPNENLEK